MIKLIATDLDGTLLNGKGELSKNSVRAIQAAVDKGIMFVACSGRFYSSVNAIFSKYRGMVIISDNGSWIQEADYGKVLFKQAIAEEKANSFLKYVNDNYDVGLFKCDGYGAVLDDPKEYMVQDFKRIKAEYRVVDNLFDYKGDTCRLGICCYPEFPNGIYEDLRLKFKDEFHLAFGGKNWLDIMDKGISKGHAIEIIQGMYGIKPEETLVFGDYYNDIGMFKKAYYSFAMEKAPDDVKRYANFIAKSNEEDGVAEEILKLCV
jgi:Cof subfamily protein (haloacid dehalogenase superfamily)